MTRTRTFDPKSTSCPPSWSLKAGCSDTNSSLREVSRGSQRLLNEWDYSSLYSHVGIAFVRVCPEGSWVCFSFCLHLRGGTPKRELTYKKLCIYSYMFKCQSPSKYSIWCNTPIKTFFPQFETFELVDFDAFWYLCHFLFHLFHIGKMFLFEYFFYGGVGKVAQGEIEWIGRVGH